MHGSLSVGKLWGACVCIGVLFWQGPLPRAAVLDCVECLLEVNCFDRTCLVPFGGPELLARVEVFRRGDAGSETCLINRLTGVQRWLLSLEKE